MEKATVLRARLEPIFVKTLLNNSFLANTNFDFGKINLHRLTKTIAASNQRPKNQMIIGDPVKIVYSKSIDTKFALLKANSSAFYANR